MMLDRLEGNEALKEEVGRMLSGRRLSHSLLLIGEQGLGAGFAARTMRTAAVRARPASRQQAAMAAETKANAGCVMCFMSGFLPWFSVWNEMKVRHKGRGGRCSGAKRGRGPRPDRQGKGGAVRQKTAMGGGPGASQAARAALCKQAGQKSFPGREAGQKQRTRRGPGPLPGC